MAQSNGKPLEPLSQQAGPLTLTTDDLLLIIGRLTVENQALRAWVQRLERAQEKTQPPDLVGVPQA